MSTETDPVPPSAEALDAHAPQAMPEDASPSSPMSRLLRVLVPLGVIAGGAAFAFIMVKNRPEAEQAVRELRRLPVQVQSFPASEQAISVEAQGTVIAAQKIMLSPQISGRVVWMNPNLVLGGQVSEGEPLLRIDASDYSAALQQSRAQVESSRVGLQQEASRRRIAEREWSLLRSERASATDEGRQLALRQPHLRSAEATVQAARSGVVRARNNLRRTTLRAPFNAFVQSQSVDVGQMVAPGSQLAALVNRDKFWVQASVPVAKLAWITFPSPETAEGPATLGSRVEVWQPVGEEGRIERSGRVVRLLGDLDPVGGMARVLVEVQDPFGQATEGPASLGDVSRLPLLLGAFVRLSIDAGTLDAVHAVPRVAVHGTDTLHLFGEGDRLEHRQVEILWRRNQTLLVQGIEDRDAIIISRVPSSVPGTLLRLVDEGQPERETRLAPESESGSESQSASESQQ